MKDWYILSDGNEGAKERWLSEVPPWRQWKQNPNPELKSNPLQEKPSYRLPPAKGSGVSGTLERINIALALRRPLLLKGPPGIGKSSLASYLACELQLGAPLIWSINSQSSLKEGLYHYDAIGHLSSVKHEEGKSIDEFITLGPLGTALLPWFEPRVLLIDEIDKSNYDLPNDLLNVLERGIFNIPELRRGMHDETTMIYVNDMDKRVSIENGQVKMAHHPVIVMTSNDERQFSEAFLRRCVVLPLSIPEREQMIDIVHAHMPSYSKETIAELYDELNGVESQPTDVILQTLYITLRSHMEVDARRSVFGVLKRERR